MFADIKKFFKENNYPKELVLGNKKLIMYYNNNRKCNRMGVDIYLVDKNQPRPRYKRFVESDKFVHAYYRNMRVSFTMNHYNQLFS